MARLLSEIESLYNQADTTNKKYWDFVEGATSPNSALAQSGNTYATDALEQANKEARGVKEVMGQTGSSYAHTLKANADAYGRMKGQLAGTLAAQRLQARNNYLAQQQQVLNNRLARKQQQNANIAQAASGIIQAGLSTVGAIYGGPAGAAVGKAAGSAIGTGITSAVSSNDGLVVPDDAFSNNAGDIKLMSV